MIPRDKANEIMKSLPRGGDEGLWAAVGRSQMRDNIEQALTELEHERVGYKRMARYMVTLIPPNLIPVADFARAEGDVVCEKCGMEYVFHPVANHMETFHLLCNGRVVKT